ncbi:MAG: hypothetical protein LC790_07870 [Actinobacteria bacterium]|nr:hypothetical protein [Actinomycetota bacterium]
MALATYVAPATAFGAVGATWVAVVLLGAVWSQDLLVAFGAAAQIGFALLCCGALVVLVLRRDHLELERTL